MISTLIFQVLTYNLNNNLFSFVLQEKNSSFILGVLTAQQTNKALTKNSLAIEAKLLSTLMVLFIWIQKIN